jgi:hypothetical protein
LAKRPRGSSDAVFVVYQDNALFAQQLVEVLERLNFGLDVSLLSASDAAAQSVRLDADAIINDIAAEIIVAYRAAA